MVELPDPVGQVLSATELDEGLNLYKISCPIGLIGVIFEARPDVVPQIAALTAKSGNAVVLKGAKKPSTPTTHWQKCFKMPYLPCPVIRPMRLI